MRNIFAIGLGLTMLVLAGCRGTTSDQPPIHLNLNMDFQEKFKAQSDNPLFKDGRSMRMPVENTVARGSHLATEADRTVKTGKDASGGFVQNNPLTIDAALLKRGQERFHIYCAPCHSEIGDGKGVIAVYGQRSNGYTIPASVHQDRLRQERDGYLYDVISNGINNMPGYAAQLPNATDRWAIVAWVRVLQRSQYANESDVPAEEKAKIRK
ncbi:MAG: cytochrome c [Bacteroidetes Order II. Incertae sedis bacterium]|nr:cytochrome c [Bacteroidetes Order II. bacterium]